jgi:carbonic anhydrase
MRPDRSTIRPLCVSVVAALDLANYLSGQTIETQPMRTHTKEFQASLTPQQAFQILKEGNRRFVSNLRLHRNLLEQVNETSAEQYPFAIVLSCIDSRTGAELIFDQGLGDIFSVRVAGNVLNEDVLGSMEFACEIAGSRLVVVLGHSKCGAVKGACRHLQIGHLAGLLGKIGPAVWAVEQQCGHRSEDPVFIEQVARENTRHQMLGIVQRSPILGQLLNQGRIGIVCGMYSVESGEVDFFEEQFKPAPAQVEAASASS